MTWSVTRIWTRLRRLSSSLRSSLQSSSRPCTIPSTIPSTIHTHDPTLLFSPLSFSVVAVNSYFNEGGRWAKVSLSSLTTIHTPILYTPLYYIPTPILYTLLPSYTLIIYALLHPYTIYILYIHTHWLATRSTCTWCRLRTCCYYGIQQSQEIS